MPVNLLDGLLDPRGILLDVAFRDPREGFGRVADALVARGIVPPGAREGAVEGLLARERLHTTAVGRGVAIPHHFGDEISGSALVFLRARPPHPMDAPDGLPVDLFLALCGPAADPSRHLRTIARLCRLARGTDMLHRLRQAATPEEVMAAVADFDR